WGWECASMATGIISIALAVAVLCEVNKKPIEDWKLPIQPNALVSVFSTVAKSAMLVPITSGLGQLKWIHFDSSTARYVQHLDVFDEASRGPWGSLMIL
ncbi:hypothetical protein BU24DRAFT_318026, partial [Aaosphaeria arxii CBS 175.79]